MMKSIHHGLRFALLFFFEMIVIVGCVNESGIVDSRNVKEGMRGKLVGKVTRGPISPIERSDTQVHSEPVAGVKLVILTLAGKEIGSVATDESGGYSIILPPGRYQIDMSPPLSTGWTKDLPAIVTIIENSETCLDIRIDTGIR